MAEFKLVLSDPKTGKSIQREAKENVARSLIGKKIKDTIKGELIDLPGYEFVITGGSDNAGFPMRSDISGSMRKRITAVKGIGVTNKLRKPNPKKKGWRRMKGMRLKKTVAGDTVHDKTAQINMKVTKHGRDPIFGDAKESAKPETKAAPKEKKEAPKAAEKPAEEKKTVKKEAPAAPAKETKAAEKPAEEKKAPKKAKAEKPASPSKEETLVKEAEEIDEKVKKDEEDVAKDDAEIAEAEEELKKVDKALEE
jgi:small subunit ribosomal protein S6e